jgi:hypothetical protein
MHLRGLELLIKAHGGSHRLQGDNENMLFWCVMLPHHLIDVPNMLMPELQD